MKLRGSPKERKRSLEETKLLSGKLHNSVRYIISSDPTTPNSQVVVLVHIGARHESHGIPHLIEHLTFLGTKNFSFLELNYQVTRHGGNLNASTNHDYTEYKVKVAGGEVEGPLRALSDMVLNPLLKEVSREKKVVLDELRRNYPTGGPDLRDFQVRKLVFKGTSLARFTGGEPKEVKRVKAAQVRNFFKQTYTPDRILVSVHSPLEPTKVLKLVKEVFGGSRALSEGIKEEKKVSFPLKLDLLGFHEKQAKKRIKISKALEEKEEVYLGVGVPGTPFGHSSTRTLDLIGVILAGNSVSRLSLKLREQKGFTYSVSYSLEAYQDVSLFKVVTGTSKKNYPEALRLVEEEFDNLIKTKVSEEELRKAKEYLTGNLKLDWGKSQASLQAEVFLYTGKLLTVQELVEAYWSITSSEVQEVASSFLLKRKRSVVVTS